jgi:hypothetical protein
MLVRPRFLRAALALAVLGAAVGLGAAEGCGPDQNTFWVCLNPQTGKEDGSIYDANNFVDGMPDPCHCYDACGPAKTCPIPVDAGTPPSGCDGGTGTGGAAGGNG